MTDATKRERPNRVTLMLIAIGLVAAIVAVAAIVVAPKSGKDALNVVEGTAHADTDTQEEDESDDLSKDEIARTVTAQMGHKDKNVKTGKKVDARLGAHERGAAAFSDGTLGSRKEISKFLNQDTAAAKAARKAIRKCLQKEIGKGWRAEYKRAMSGEGYYPVQFKTPVDWYGTSYLVGGEMLTMQTARRAGPQDVLWLFIAENNKPILCASFRADCANPGLRKVTPSKPGEPVTPVECPPGSDRPECNPTPPPPPAKKCTDNVSASDGYCGTPTSGPEQYHPEDPGRTEGYVPGNAEEVAGNQPDSNDIDTDCGRYGCNSGGGGGSAPAGESENTDTGQEEQGTNEGTSDPEETEGSGQTSEAGSDPCQQDPAPEGC